jgi:hypothetical protein
MAAFKLSKWYLDCVTDSGDTAIAYAGLVRWGPVHLSYSSLLESTGDRLRNRHTLRPRAEPAVGRGSIRWAMDALKVSGEWQADSVELREKIFSSDAGSVDWHCLLPRARARMNAKRGLGYAEHLTMTVAPWNLPIRTLRWGRFASPSDWVVWIDWQGDFSRRIAYCNGISVPISRLDDGRIDFEDGTRLTMDCSLVLRQGQLGATALSVIPGVRDTFPGRLLQVNETKWRSRAQFETPGRPAVESWAIHEIVSWPE